MFTCETIGNSCTGVALNIEVGFNNVDFGSVLRIKILLAGGITRLGPITYPLGKLEHVFPFDSGALGISTVRILNRECLCVARYGTIFVAICYRYSDRKVIREIRYGYWVTLVKLIDERCGHVQRVSCIVKRQLFDPGTVTDFTGKGLLSGVH